MDFWKRECADRFRGGPARKSRETAHSESGASRSSNRRCASWAPSFRENQLENQPFVELSRSQPRPGQRGAKGLLRSVSGIERMERGEGRFSDQLLPAVSWIPMRFKSSSVNCLPPDFLAGALDPPPAVEAPPPCIWAQPKEKRTATNMKICADFFIITPFLKIPGSFSSPPGTGTLYPRPGLLDSARLKSFVLNHLIGLTTAGIMEQNAGKINACGKKKSCDALKNKRFLFLAQGCEQTSKALPPQSETGAYRALFMATGCGTCFRCSKKECASTDQKCKPFR